MLVEHSRTKLYGNDKIRGKKIMNLHTISVVIPSYNREMLISDAIESVIKQTHRVDEIIIVDDNSSDDTNVVVKQLAEKYNYIKYIRNDVNVGGGGSRNIGIQNATGDIIAFLDSDDVWRENRIERQIQEFDKSEVVAAFCNYDMVQYETGEVIGTNDRAITHRDNDIYVGNYLGSTSCLMARRSTLIEIGMFDASLKSCQDWDIYIRLLQKGKFVYCKDLLLTQYFHGQRMSGKKENVVQGLLSLINKMPLYAQNAGFSKYKTNRVLSALYYRLGVHYCRFMDKKQAYHCLKKAVNYNIYNLKLLKLIVMIMKVRVQ